MRSNELNWKGLAAEGRCTSTCTPMCQQPECPKSSLAPSMRSEEPGAQSEQAALGHESNEANVDCVTLALVNMGSRRPHWRILWTPSLSHKNRGKKYIFSNSRAHDRKAPLKYNLHRHPVLTHPAWVAVKSLLARSNLTAATHLKEPVKSSKRRGKKH